MAESERLGSSGFVGLSSNLSGSVRGFILESEWLGSWDHNHRHKHKHKHKHKHNHRHRHNHKHNGPKGQRALNPKPLVYRHAAHRCSVSQRIEAEAAAVKSQRRTALV